LTIALVSDWQGDATQPFKELKMRQINGQMTWTMVSKNMKDKGTAVVSGFPEQISQVRGQWNETRAANEPWR
jgi:hypothetical protein